MVARLALVLAIGCFMAIDTANAADAQSLIEAAKRGDLAAVQAALVAGVDPDAHDDVANTALIFAARDGELEIARALIDHGATVDWIDGEGVTPLILASFKGRLALVRLLLDHGADTAVRDQWDRSALDYARRRGDADPIAQLLRAR